LLFVSVNVFAQNADQLQRRTYDFSKVDPEMIDEVNLRDQYDSLYRTLWLGSLRQRLEYRYANVYSKDYASFSIGIFGQVASLKSLNKGLREAGTEAINDQFFVLPLGLNVKTARFQVSNLWHIVSRNKSEDASRKLDIRGFWFEMGLGYDVINGKRFQLYPQVALAYEAFNLKAAKRDAPTNIG
jgi:hypothetical protein